MRKRWSIVLMGSAFMAACTSSPRATPGTPSAAAPTTPGPAASSAVGAATGAGGIDPATFGTTVDNPYFPLTPGTTLVYSGVRDGKSQRDEVVVTSRTKEILGVPCVVVEDTATHNGELLEKTEDWFAQDLEGTVWYFGEDTAEYEKGKVVSTEGSWQAGVDGAVAGIVMPSHPTPPTSYRQEFYRGQAEDMAWVVSSTDTLTVATGTYHDVVLTLEWTALEPNVIDRKYYAKGIGIVLEVSAAGPKERAELVSS